MIGVAIYIAALLALFGAVAAAVACLFRDLSREQDEIRERAAEELRRGDALAFYKVEAGIATPAPPAPSVADHPYRTAAQDRRAAVIRDAVWMRNALARGNKVGVTYNLRSGIHSTRDIEEVLAACIVELTREST